MKVRLAELQRLICAVETLVTQEEIRRVHSFTKSAGLYSPKKETIAIIIFNWEGRRTEVGQIVIKSQSFT